MHDDSLCILWDCVAPHIRYLGAVYRDECSRGVVRGKPDEIVELLGPGRRKGLSRALQHVMVDHPRRRKRGKGGKEYDYAAQHVGGERAGGKEGIEWAKWRTRAAPVIILTYMWGGTVSIEANKAELHSIPRSREGTGPKTYTLAL